MITNQMYEKSMVLIFKKSHVIGWMSTDKEADIFCYKNHGYSWDYYSLHKDYVDMNKLLHMTIYSKV